MRSLGIIVAFGLLFSFIVQTKAEALEGVRAFKPVLEGTLYRGGGAGGKKPLSSKALQALCEEGFSSAIYLYSTGFKGDETVECKTKSGSNNRLKYTSMSFRSERKDILEKVYEVATNSSLGPIFVHCWNGKHAAGEISAIALKQFCDYSSDAAASYWKKNIDDNPNDYTSIWKKHIPGFKQIDDLKISSSIQKDLCP